MKVSKNNINEYINLYINDLEDYGEFSKEEFLLTENTLRPLGKLLLESKKTPKQVITELYNKSPQQQKPILKDFLLYIENI